MLLEIRSNRAGRVVGQPTGYEAFIPAPLPPDPPLQISFETASLLQDATLELGKLEGLTQILPNPDLFLRMFVQKEALLSSQIEGTQATLEDVLEYEVRRKLEREDSSPARAVSNYVHAMNYGLERLKTLPLSLRLIREIHQRLMQDVRGGHTTQTPGEFRRSQNWIGPGGCTLQDAVFVPPPPDEMETALYDLEKHLHEDSPFPLLLHCALVHAQFESIHPFIDGNGRMGRLLMTFQLCHAGVLSRPLLYLSYYFKAHRDEYYRLLNAVRSDGDWEEWVKYFLRGVATVAHVATETAKQIVELHKEDAKLLTTIRPRGAVNALKMLDLLFEKPVVDVASVVTTLGVTQPTANELLRTFEDAGILREMSGRAWGRYFLYDSYVKILSEGTEL